MQICGKECSDWCVMSTNSGYKRSSVEEMLHSHLGNLFFTVYPTLSPHLPPWLAISAVEATSQGILAMEPTSMGPTEPLPWTVLCLWVLPWTMAVEPSIAPATSAMVVWVTTKIQAVAMVAASTGHGALALASATAPTDGSMALMTTRPSTSYLLKEQPEKQCLSSSLLCNWKIQTTYSGTALWWCWTGCQCHPEPHLQLRTARHSFL